MLDAIEVRSRVCNSGTCAPAHTKVKTTQKTVSKLSLLFFTFLPLPLRRLTSQRSIYLSLALGKGSHLHIGVGALANGVGHGVAVRRECGRRTGHSLPLKHIACIILRHFLKFTMAKVACNNACNTAALSDTHSLTYSAMGGRHESVRHSVCGRAVRMSLEQIEVSDVCKPAGL